MIVDDEDDKEVNRALGLVFKTIDRPPADKPMFHGRYHT